MPTFFIKKSAPENGADFFYFRFFPNLLGKLVAAGRTLRRGHGFAFAHEHAVQGLSVFVDHSVSSGFGTNVAAVQSHFNYLRIAA
jgi:hypothetical protein